MWMHTRAHRNRISPAESVQELEGYDYITDDESERCSCENHVRTFNMSVQQTIVDFCTNNSDDCTSFKVWKEKKVEGTCMEINVTFNASAWLLNSLNLTITLPEKDWPLCNVKEKLELKPQHKPPACMPYTIPTFEEWNCGLPTTVNKSVEQDLETYEADKKKVLRQMEVASLQCQLMYEEDEKITNDIWASFTKYLVDKDALNNLVSQVDNLLEIKCLPPGLDPLWVTFQSYVPQMDFDKSNRQKIRS